MKATSFLPLEAGLSRVGTAGGMWNSATGLSGIGWFLEERRVPLAGLLLTPDSLGGSFHPFSSLLGGVSPTVRRSVWAVDKCLELIRLASTASTSNTLKLFSAFLTTGSSVFLMFLVLFGDGAEPCMFLLLYV